jgi:Uncharacterized conserved protein
MSSSHTPDQNSSIQGREDRTAQSIIYSPPDGKTMSVSTDKQLYIGEGFEGPGVNLAHINVLVGPRNGPAGQASPPHWRRLPRGMRRSS